VLLIVLRSCRHSDRRSVGGAVLIATESAPPTRRGYYGSFAQVGAPPVSFSPILPSCW